MPCCCCFLGILLLSKRKRILKIAKDIKRRLFLPRKHFSWIIWEWVCTTEEILPYIQPLLYAFLRHLLLRNELDGCTNGCVETPWISRAMLMDWLLICHWLVVRHKRKDKASRQGYFPWILFQAPLVYSALFFIFLSALLLPQISPLSLIWDVVA